MARPDVVPARESEIANLMGSRIAIDGMVHNYRILGHTQAKIDPLAQSRPETPALTLAALGLEDVPLDTVVSSRYFRQSRR